VSRSVPIAALCIATLFAACSGSDKPDVFRPIDSSKAVFWDRQTTETAELLREIVDDFNAAHSGMPVAVEHVGNYSDIFRKVTVSIEARTLPAMAVGYESMTTEYVSKGAVARLDPYIEDPERGLSEEDLADFFPVALETNRYESLGNGMYSFPFCKSVLVMYYNNSVLSEAGIEAPPETWDAFLEQCRQIKARTGKYAYAVSVDCSTIDGMIYSMGGEVVSGTETRFDSPEALKVFNLLNTLAREELAYQIQPGTYEDEEAFAQNRIAFALRSSSGRTNLLRLMKGDLARWGMARIPQADPRNPRTVLYGPNIMIFNVNDEAQKQVAWAFVKYFTSPEITVKWALGTGYLPIRKSAANNPDIQAFWNEWESNKTGFDCLSFAKSEPNLEGWQEVRGLVEDAERAILSGMKTPDEAAKELKRKADAVLGS
jgi:multiple sugar transport system substrate-binding protein